MSGLPRNEILLARLEAGLLADVCAALDNVCNRLYVAQDHENLVALVSSLQLDLAILEVHPAGDALEVCRRWRQQGRANPVLLLSGLSQESDRVLGLNAGADSYLAKPFGMRELQARVRALLRRGRVSRATPRKLVYGSLSLDLVGREVQVGGLDVSLTPHEFSLLATLTAAPGVAFSRRGLIDEAWGRDYVSDERLVDTYVRNLRAKLGRYSRHILTVRGLGYKFAPQGYGAGPVTA